ncbi:hypothetical protein [Novosphingobium sp. AP12]|uniref:hypothetical protein n=1 Tax=Novosphingobium sp. AP12 TaxID=1144305 RepID=UPI000271FBAB|nr:hypothetical protein [Novosphingobium sp. AP12]EJL22852.1 hypothetical protein PMI02_04406 [Novosphingobium sp. AP12]
MTTLILWTAVDSRGPSAIYVASDSRITWGTAHSRWDSGRKVFSGGKFPDIFGYAGDVLFPSLVISQVTELSEQGFLWQNSHDAEERHAIFIDSMKNSIGRRHNSPDQDFHIFHGARDGAGLSCTFKAWKTSYSVSKREFIDRAIDVYVGDPRSRLLAAVGSGEDAFMNEIVQWQSSSQTNTSRAIYSAFCDALHNKIDPLSGGSPQLVGLYRKASAKVFGHVDGNGCHVLGLPVDPSALSSEIEWRDRLFQRVCPHTGDIVPGAQRQFRDQR